jgi:hypothetical protein
MCCGSGFRVQGTVPHGILVQLMIMMIVQGVCCLSCFGSDDDDDPVSLYGGCLTDNLWVEFNVESDLAHFNLVDWFWFRDFVLEWYSDQ